MRRAGHTINLLNEGDDSSALSNRLGSTPKTMVVISRGLFDLFLECNVGSLLALLAAGAIRPFEPLGGLPITSPHKMYEHGLKPF